MKMEHARYSPSKLEVLELCPKFQSKPDDPDKGVNEAAEEGKLLHEAVATKNLVGLTKDQQDLVNEALTYAEAVKLTMPPGTVELTEFKVELKDLTFGTLDKAFLVPDKKAAHVIDWKFGRLPVTSAMGNFQLQCYCGGMFEAYPELESVTGHMVAPRQQHTDTAVFDRGLVGLVRARIERLYRDLADPFCPPASSETDACAMCANAARCPTLCKTAVAVARGIGLPIPATFAANALVAPEDRARAQLIATALAEWGEQVKKNNTEYVLGGGELPGYKLIQRGTGVKIKQEDTYGAWTRLRDAGLASQEELMAACTLSIKVLAENAAELRGTKKQEETAKVLELLSDLLQTGTCSYLQKVKS